MDSSTLKIEDIEIGDEHGIASIVELHMELLDFGPMAGLGPRFIRDVGYRINMEDGVLKTALCRVEGEPAGFVAYTAQSIGFHRKSLSAHWPRVCWVLFVSLLENPSRIGNLFRALRVVASRRKEKRRGTDPMGEIVAIAVRRKFLNSKYVDDQNRRLSAALVAFGQERLTEEGVEAMRMLVDADNKSALFLYHGLGATMEPYEQGGEPMVEVWFDLRSGGSRCEPGG